jgi:phosphatidylinositol glycan class V
MANTTAYPLKIRNVGFMRYWTPAQIPNFLMASPILLASVYGGFRFIDTQYRLLFPSTFQRSISKARLGDNSRSSLGDIDRTLWRNPDVIPFFLIHIITTTILLFASHTQIALRVSIGNPVLFWVVAALLAEGEKTRLGRWARYGIVWTCVWGALSLVLWAGFYPPA